MEEETTTPEVGQDENENYEDVTETNAENEYGEDTPKKDWEAEAKKYKAILDRKTKKAEEKVESPKDTNKGEEPTLSPLDAVAIARENVPLEDVDDVIEIAKLKNVSVREALGLSLTKTILAEKEEHRKSAKATNAGGGKRAPKAISGDALLRDLKEGKTPEPGSKEAEELFWAKRGGRK